MRIAFTRPARAAVRRLSALAVASLVAAAALAACSSGSAGASGPQAAASSVAASSSGTSLDRPVDAAVLALALTDEHGRSFTLASLRGKTVVLADFLTTCQEVCPMTSVNVRDAAGDAVAAGLSSSVLFLEVTVDPQRDDPARLAAYQKLYGSRPAWDLATAGATGTAALWKFLGVYYAKVPADNPAPTDWLTGKPLTYDVNHQDVVIILGPDGHERWIAQGTPDTGGQQPPATLAHFLNDQGRANLASPQAQGPVWTTPDIDQALSRVTGRTITPRATADDTTASATTGG